MQQFDHEKLEVYQHSIEFVGWVCEHIADLSGKHRNARDQVIRSLQSIPLNVAEENAKRTGPDRRRFFETARDQRWSRPRRLTYPRDERQSGGGLQDREIDAPADREDADGVGATKRRGRLGVG